MLGAPHATSAGWVLLAARRALSAERHTRLSDALSFLHREYEPRFFWWELVEMLRRLVLVGLLVLVRGLMQIVIGLSLSAIFAY